MGLSILYRIANGDSAAVHECIKHYGPMVWSLARRLSRTTEDAEDATQEIFLDIWRSAKRHDEALGTERLFVAVIARRRLIDRLRKVALQPPMDSIDCLEIGSCVDYVLAADRSVAMDSANRVLNELQPDQRKVLLLSLMQGLSHTEIAVQLAMPLGTVKTLIRRGLLRARELMNEPTAALSPLRPKDSSRCAPLAVRQLGGTLIIPLKAPAVPTV